MEAMDLFVDTPHSLVTSDSSQRQSAPHARPDASGCFLGVSPAHSHVPTAESLLEVDRLYRMRAAQDALPKIAPKHLNRSGVAWLPVMQLDSNGWYFSAKFSNTLRANRLGKTSDWVIINYRSNAGARGRVTVMTVTRGSSRGKRILRGYADMKNAAD